MRSATARRFALVAVMVVLVPGFCRAVSDARGLERTGGLFVGLAAAATAPALGIRRHATAWSWARASSTAPVRGPSTATLAALLSLLLLARWATLAALPAASPLSRRRHAIALRGPPWACTP